jgi:hypothetical protein
MATADNISVTSNMTTAEFKNIKLELQKIKTHEELKEHIMINDDKLYNIPTPLLNSWINIPNYKLFRHHNVLGVTKADETRASTMTKLRDEIIKLKNDVKIIKDEIIKLKEDVLKIIDIQKNHHDLLFPPQTVV